MWSGLRLVLGLVLAVVAVNVVAGRRDELEGATTLLTHLRWEWLLLAVPAELASVVAFAAIERRMLAAGGVQVGIRPLTGIALAGNSIQNSLPGGVAWASVFAYRQFRSLGADDVLAAWSMVAVEILSAVSLAVLAAVGVVLAGDEAASLDLVGSILVVLVVAVAIAGVVRYRTGHLPVAVGTWAVRLSQRLVRRPHGDPAAVARQGWERLTAVTPTRRDWLAGLAWATTNWVADCACLAISFLAVGSPVPWQGLLLAYGAGQLAANLPITPGGLGVVEGSLAIALVAYGNSRASTVAAVLLYRVVSFWAMLPLGWGAWAVLASRGRRLTDPAGEATTGGP
jgi:uncharacterized protein (TIRG00374 family)